MTLLNSTHGLLAQECKCLAAIFPPIYGCQYSRTGLVAQLSNFRVIFLHIVNVKNLMGFKKRLGSFSCFWWPGEGCFVKIQIFPMTPYLAWQAPPGQCLHQGQNMLVFISSPCPQRYSKMKLRWWKGSRGIPEDFWLSKFCWHHWPRMMKVFCLMSCKQTTTWTKLPNDLVSRIIEGLPPMPTTPEVWSEGSRA